MVQKYLDLLAWLKQAGYSLSAAAAQLAADRFQFEPRMISTDTRSLQPGALYVPLRGERFDGHDYLLQAFETGAALALCEQSVFEATEALQQLPLILVDHTLAAYQDLARSWHRQLGTPVIGITGSSGKTSTKEILYQVLSPFFVVHRTEANLNNEIGVPHTLLALQPEHQLCIVEMGMRGLGQITTLCSIAEPVYGIITNIGPVHLSELGSQEAIAQAKWELARYLEAHQGLLVINTDNTWLQRLGAEYPGRLLRCGQAEEADLQLQAFRLADQGQQLFYCFEGQDYQASLDLEGLHQALNLLCCLGVLSALQPLPASLDIAVPRLSGRQEEIRLKPELTLINDSYNANPDSMRAALQVLAARPGQRVAILGKMAELGPDAERFHIALGAYCRDLGLDQLVVIGTEAAGIATGFGADAVWFYPDNAAAIADLPNRLDPLNGQILVKASRSARLEEIVHALRDRFAAPVA
ncbi:MAG: UDP-N-acetylmuramoyl-tripeptide--D-alanyl-D-alanine ligase [Candidatus Sericytochromatia bacterium]|nr:UDP-N-acetylmuramoyl-tripeptide--D-alanyl-D-alanine ligase [Candidatus Sericytochromatia bacterium]